MKSWLKIILIVSSYFWLLPTQLSFSAYYLLPEQRHYDVSFYNINLTLHLDNNSIQGNVNIEGEIVHDQTTAIILNFFDQMTVDSVKMHYLPLNFVHSNDLLTISLPHSLNAGERFSLTVYYHGFPMLTTPSGYGLIFTTYNNEKLVYSYHWPYYANSYLPCKDHPSDKADSLRLAITVPAAYQVAANGVLDSLLTLPDNMVQFIWKSHYPLTPYHISINVHPFVEIQQVYASPISGNIPLLYFLFPNHSSAAQVQLNAMVPKILQAFETKYGSFPFPTEKYGICESVISGGMEHQTILTMNYPSFFSDIVVHESAHEYFGNMISIADWGHIWLSEGFATYSEAIYREYWEGETGYNQEIIQHMAGAGNGMIYVTDPSSPNNIIPYNLVYLKASAVLHMLRYVMRDSLFFRMLQDYVTISPFRYKNIDTEQFCDFCESYYGDDLSWFFQQWIYGDGKMAARYYYYRNDGSDSLILKYRSVSSTTNGTYHSMPVPLTISATGFQLIDTLWIDSLNRTRVYPLLDTTNLTLQFDPDNKILKGNFSYLNRPEFVKVAIQPDSDNIRAEWEPFFDFSDYQLYIWKKDTGGSFTLLDSLNVHGLRKSITPPVMGTYRLALRAVKGNHRTDLSEFKEINFSTFPMNQGILLVDETRNGNGTHMLLPTDQAVDSFYHNLLSEYTFTEFDVINEGCAPSLLDLGDYALVIWHHDVNYQTVVAEIQSEIGTYLTAGGKMIFSGMNYLNNFSPDFRSEYLGITQYDMNSSWDFIGASGSSGFPDLPLDTSKITFPLYNHKLPNVMIFDTTSGTESIYLYQSSGVNPQYHLKPTGVRSRSPKNTSVLSAFSLGLPLYFMNQDSAREFIRKAIADFGITVNIDKKKLVAIDDFEIYPNYPNPFNPSTKILFRLNKLTHVDIFIYNLLGERISSLYRGSLPGGLHEVEWDGRNEEGVLQASGIYFVKIKAGSHYKTIKIILQH